MKKKLSPLITTLARYSETLVTEIGTMNIQYVDFPLCQFYMTNHIACIKTNLKEKQNLRAS